MSSTSQLPNLRTVRTTHSPDGTSVFLPDEHVAPSYPLGPGKSAFFNFHCVSSVPADISKLDRDQQQLSSGGPPRCPPAGVYFGVVDFPPNYRAPMHRTLSLDYGCVLSGEIVLSLDGGDEKTVKAGEFIVQGGVNHEWINRTDSVARVLFTMVGSEKITLESGEALEEGVFGQRK